MYQHRNLNYFESRDPMRTYPRFDQFRSLIGSKKLDLALLLEDVNCTFILTGIRGQSF